MRITKSSIKTMTGLRERFTGAVFVDAGAAPDGAAPDRFMTHLTMQALMIKTAP